MERGEYIKVEGRRYLVIHPRRRHHRSRYHRSRMRVPGYMDYKALP